MAAHDVELLLPDASQKKKIPVLEKSWYMYSGGICDRIDRVAVFIQSVRLYYFIILGIAAIAVQAYNIFRKRVEEEEG